ncbi:DUF4255 domain-containing protein [Paenibacillus oleatilyticus]|uniref:DUF4255 domain-containing protein n=1 Tax=Paenibacillus oleatilyticus TaxID=2594886 RepID=UPI001C1F3C75|nr:DUF4255 domain-containing protein [Paenibacillus oleatilyticus]MBU7314212.1 DUF4255 domain-containing protein [Paenibacillus oleatilyticus]
MADYTVIADVGNTLVKLLREHLTPKLLSQPEAIGLASPTDKGDFQLTLFLYSIQENTENRRTNMIGRGTDTLQYPPMALNLVYLVTCHSASELATRSFDEHRIMGKVMQVFHDHAVLRGSSLQGSLADSNEAIRIMPQPITLENAVSLFSNTPYKLSLSYVVGPVYLDSTRTKQTTRVAEAQFKLEEREGN